MFIFHRHKSLGWSLFSQQTCSKTCRQQILLKLRLYIPHINPMTGSYCFSVWGCHHQQANSKPQAVTIHFIREIWRSTHDQIFLISEYTFLKTRSGSVCGAAVCLGALNRRWALYIHSLQYSVQLTLTSLLHKGCRKNKLGKNTEQWLLLPN